MIGSTIERLKNPKNVVPWLLTGWVVCAVGYFIFTNWQIEPAGQLIAVLGLLAIVVTLVRVAVTKPVYAIIIGVLFVVYMGAYAGKANWSSRTHTAEIDSPEGDTQRQITRWSAKYSGSKVAQTALAAAFAPAAMGNAILSSKIKGGEIGQWAPKHDLADSELGESIREYQKRTGRK